MRKNTINTYLSTRYILLFLLLFFKMTSEAQVSDSFFVKFKWNGIEKVPFWGDTISRISFEDVSYISTYGDEIPVYRHFIQLYDANVSVDFVISSIEYEKVPENEISLLPDNINERPYYESYLQTSRDEAKMCFELSPFFKNDDGYMRLLSCEVDYQIKENEDKLVRNKSYIENSVLSSGKWYKMQIPSTGMYKISRTTLLNMGIDADSIDPRNIRIYHNGGGVLPIINGEQRHEDLVEIPIYVHGEADGSFDATDYVIFYAVGPVKWELSGDYYERILNPYSDFSCAFLTVDLGRGKRIEEIDAVKEKTDEVVNSFLDYKIIDNDDVNLNNMGATWYSAEAFDAVTEHSYTLNFPNVIKTKKACFAAEVASRNMSSASFIFKINSNTLSHLSFNSVDTQYSFANTKSTGNQKFNPSNDDIVVNVTYSKSGSSSKGWMDFITVNAWRELIYTGGQMLFRNPECDNSLKNYQYEIRNASSSMQVWDVTNSVEPKKINLQYSSNSAYFAKKGSENNEFIAFNNDNFKSVIFDSVVKNQNLHSVYDFDYLIISHPNFIEQAMRLKDIHSRIDDLEIEIVTPEVIYNEFSCGALDITAIRDYIKMIYDKSNRRLRYVLLFGDASYDFRNKSGSVCFIPTYESVASCSISQCIATDDFYVCMDQQEGNMENSSSVIDLAIGRIPVSTKEDADAMIDKIESYIAINDESAGIWRKVFTFIADDNDHYYMNNCEKLEEVLNSYDESIDIDKIYLDAYPQISTSSGQRAPECNEAITNRVERGSLIVNYIGHAGEVGWTTERILTNEDILSWRNSPKLNLMLTASCEFTRFDDHTRTSAGEFVYLNHNGGAISMITTSRVTTAGPNFALLKRFYEHIFDIEGGDYIPMGDLFVHAKQDGVKNDKVYVFLGDPALKLNYPKNYVEITTLNGHSLDQLDTISALQNVSITGVVNDVYGNMMTDFNGLAYINIYDKENTITTFGDESSPMEFKLRNSLIYTGKVPVLNGEFSANFTLPKDINYSYGNGLMSFYANSDITDAQGSFSNFIVGGLNPNAETDDESPEVQIFIDDELFVDGSLTNENPLLIAYIKDKNGINTSGAGIGHDITATLSGATNKTYNLNQYYDSPLTTDEFGKLTYKFYDLNEGEHLLTFRVWDIYNNSSTATIRFYVEKGKNISIENVHNYPNPMNDYTNFVFDHNQKDNKIEIEIKIYNIVGQLVKVINESSYGTSTRINPIKWDGKSDNGVSLPAGLYVYNITVSNSNNVKTLGFSKLIIK